MPLKTIRQLDEDSEEAGIVFNHSNTKLVSRKTKVKPSREQAFFQVLHYKKPSSGHHCAGTKPSQSPSTQQPRCKAEKESHSVSEVSQKLQIFVRSTILPVTRALCLQLDPETSILSLKELIHSKIGVEPQNQRLVIRRNFELCDFLTVSENGVEKDETISLLLSTDGLLGGGPKGKAQFDDQYLVDLSLKIETTWKGVAKNLGYEDAKIAEIRTNYENNSEQSRQMLLTWWRQQENHEEALKKLTEALTATGFADLAKEISETPRVPITTDVTTRPNMMNNARTEAVWTMLKSLVQTHGQSYVIELFSDFLLSIDGNLDQVRTGSVTFVVRVGSRKGLDKLWTMYNTGELDKRLTEILITDELTTEDKSDLAIQATILETDYKKACRFFQELENPQQQGGSSTRRKVRAQHIHPGEGSSSTTLRSTDPAHGAADRYDGSCHLTWPELRAFVADRQRLSQEEGTLAKEEWDFSDRPTYYTAVRNLQGFVAYHLNKHDQALIFFHDVLNKDKNNINALGNVVFIHNKLYEIDKRNIYRKKLKLVLGSLSYEELARAYADKAHAIRYFDKRRFQYMKFIERAVTIGRKCKGPQTAEWSFDYALALYRRDKKMLYLRKLANAGPTGSEHSYSDERVKESFLKACRFFLEVARTSTSKDYQALSWVFLGILVNHDAEHRSLSMAFPEEPQLHLTADECYERGLEINPDHEIVMRRVGSEYVQVGRFAEARDLLDKSLGLLPSQFGYRHRALMFLTMYETAIRDGKRAEEAHQWLLKAKEDFTQAVKFKKRHADVSDLGYVYFRLGDTTEALSMFRQAASSEQDDDSDQVLTHKRWAQCLEKINQMKGSRRQQEEARKIRKKILETPLKEDQLDYVSDDFENYSTEEKLGFVRILLNYHFWAAYRRKRTSEVKPTDSMALSPRRTRLGYDFFVWHAERDSLWAMAFVHKLESEHGLLGCIQRRDFKVGRKISSEIMRCLRESYRFVIILTPEPDMKSLVRVIRQAEMERDRPERGGEYIVPIKLRECPVPDMLKPLTVLECKEGQILREHWDKLVLKLIQDP